MYASANVTSNDLPASYKNNINVDDLNEISFERKHIM